MSKDLKKPGIFIASSGGGLNVAKDVQKGLKKFADCELWSDMFKPGASTYDQLVTAASYYDYGIFVATADDPIISKNILSVAPRDNVIFEMGLFTGALGKGRALMVLEQGAKQLSDLDGITMPRIAKRKSVKYRESVDRCCIQIIEHITNRKQVFDLSLTPSVSLAYGYFFNFVEKAIGRVSADISKSKKFPLKSGEKIKFTKVKMNIYIPEDLNEDVFKKAKSLNIQNHWEKLKVPSKSSRDYDFFLSVKNESKSNVLVIHDIPFTLNSLEMAINALVKTGAIGKTRREKFLERKVLRDFKETLDYLIRNSSITKGKVTTLVKKI